MMMRSVPRIWICGSFSSSTNYPTCNPIGSCCCGHFLRVFMPHVPVPLDFMDIVQTEYLMCTAPLNMSGRDANQAILRNLSLQLLGFDLSTLACRSFRSYPNKHHALLEFEWSSFSCLSHFSSSTSKKYHLLHILQSKRYFPPIHLSQGPSQFNLWLHTT